jgi:tripartite-type tricarboxylate transporter receptor subunit TctC
MKWIHALVSVSAALVLPLVASAQAWPSKPLRLVVPFTAGGSTDVVARIVAEKLSPRLGQAVLVENKAGAGGAIGSEYVAKAPADGYTLLVGTSSTMAIAPYVYTKLPYNPQRDLAPVTLLGTADIMVVVNPTRVAARSIPELVAYAKAHPRKLTFASGGNGSISHLLGAYFDSMAKVEMVHVPYRGDTQMIADLLGGQVDMVFGTAVAFLPHLKSGKLVGIAVTNPTRSKSLPDLPTVSEAGVPGYEALQWFGIAAPTGTPAPVIQRLNSEIKDILALPDVRRRFADLGFDIVGNSPAEFGQFLEAENQKWKKVVDIAGAKLD